MKKKKRKKKKNVVCWLCVLAADLLLTEQQNKKSKEVKQMTKNTTGDYNIWYHMHNGASQAAKTTFVEGEERPALRA
jgi:hypothetical protein